MARPPINLGRKIKDILKHVEPLPPEAGSPLAHYRRSGTDLANLLEYVRKAFDQIGTLKPAVVSRHLAQLHGMVLVNLVETFERYLKEAAAACIDALGAFVLDDRFDGFRVQGSHLAVHFGTDTLGKALCESSTWLDTASINTRFRSLLADPFEEGKFVLFPNPKKDPPADRERYETLELVWQLRHTVVHNVGVITQSDAVKFRLLVRDAVASPRFLVPTRDDIRHLKRFLDETADVCNERLGKRLAEVLTALHTGDPTLFAPKDVADRLTATFGFVLQVAGVDGTLPSP
jgi:hypothetical protein